MIIDLTIDTAAYIAITITTTTLWWYTWKRRGLPGGFYFSFLMAALSFWAGMNVGSNIFLPGPLGEALETLTYVAVTWAGPLWLLFVLDYGYRGRWPITWKTQLVWALPVFLIPLTITNPWHGLIWPRGPVDFVLYGFAPAFLLNLGYTYLLLLVGFVLLIRATALGPGKSYHKTAVLLVGTAIPVATSLCYMFQVMPDLLVYLSPAGLLATILLYAWSIFGLKLFDLVPAARETLVRSMADGVIVLDFSGRVADLNPAAMRMLGITEAAIGQPAEAVCARWPALAWRCLGTGPGRGEVVIDDRETPVWIDVRTSPLGQTGGLVNGRLIAMRDITERKQAEDTLRRTNEQLQAEVAERRLVEGQLKAEIVERRRAEADLEVSLTEKELLLKEIHHRVKNNLQIVSSLLSLQTESPTGSDAAHSLRESQNRIKSMALVHEMLYKSSDLSVIDFKDYVGGLVTSLSNSYLARPDVRIEVAIENVTLDIDSAIPCGLIINELISNCLKYAFKDREGGTIRVSMSQEGSRYRLVIGDNGRGMPAGLDFRDTTTLGLQLVVTLVDQLSGDIEQLPGPGTTFAITF